MKKFTVIALFLSFAAVASFAETLAVDPVKSTEAETTLKNAKAKNEAAQYPSTGASKNGVVDFSFKAELYLELVSNPDFKNTLKSTKECRAVIIDKNWLLAAKSCAVNDAYVTHNGYMGAGSAPSEDKYKVLSRSYSDYKITVDDKSYGVEVTDIGNEFLIYASNKALVAALDKRPKANILITEGAIELQNFKNFNLVVRRDARFGGEKSDKVKVEQICSKDACITVENKFWNPNGAAGDPMFVVLDNGQEFLAAFNATQNYSADKNTGRSYKTISSASETKLLGQIGKTSPDTAKKVQKKIVRKIILNPKSYSFQ